MSYDINFWKQTAPLKQKPETIYGRLCEGKKVKGLATLPIPEILARLETILPEFDPGEEFALVSLENGSIEVSWSDLHFRFDFRGHVPEVVRRKLISLMAEYECPLYDPQLDKRFASADGMAIADSNDLTSKIPTLNEVIKLLAEEERVELLGPPATVSLQPADEQQFSDAGWLADLTRQATTSGYETVGDFLVPEFSVVLRVLYGKPNIFVCLYQHALGISWAEIIVINADDTTESWCTWQSDNVVPPWATRVVHQGPLLDLHDLMRAGHSGKPPAQLAPDDFAEIFIRQCSREMKWRQSHQVDRPALAETTDQETVRPQSVKRRRVDPPASTGTSFKKLPEKIRKFIELDQREYGAATSLHEYVAPLQTEFFPNLVPKIQSQEPTWTEGQCKAAATKHLMAGHPLLHRGYSKRIAEDAPSELGYSASLFARLELWWGTRNESNGFTDFASDMLRALAAGDTFVIERFANVAPHRATGGSPDMKLLHNGIVATILRDKDLLAAAITDYEKTNKPKQYITCIFTSFRGLLANDEQLVVEGLDALLKTSKKIWQLYDIFKVISLETHGMYELCRWYDPKLVASFNTTRDLPWDNGLYAWVRENEGRPPYYDVSSLSPELHEWVKELPIQDGQRHDWP